MVELKEGSVDSKIITTSRLSTMSQNNTKLFVGFYSNYSYIVLDSTFILFYEDLKNNTNLFNSSEINIFTLCGSK